MMDFQLPHKSFTCFVEDIDEHIVFKSSSDSVAANMLLNEEASVKATQDYLDAAKDLTSFKKPSDILEYVQNERDRAARQRSNLALLQRVRDDRGVEMVGSIPLIVIDLVIKYVEEHEIETSEELVYVFTDPPKKTGWTRTYKALSRTHSAFTPIAQRAMRRALCAEGTGIRGLSYSPACGPWTKRLHLQASETRYRCNFDPLEISFFWTHTLNQTPYLTTLVFDADFRQVEVFKLFLGAVSHLKRLEVLQVTERGRYLAQDMKLDSLADLFVSISKLEKLKYLGLKSFESCVSYSFSPLRNDLMSISPPSSLKTIALSRFDVGSAYSKWLLEPRGGYVLENIAVDGDSASDFVLQVNLPSVQWYLLRGNGKFTMRTTRNKLFFMDQAFFVYWVDD